MQPETSLSKARTVQAALKAQHTQLQLAKARGEVISTAEAFKACRVVISIVLERLDGVPGQVAPRVLGMQSAAEIERVVKEVLHTARAEMAKMGDAIQVVADGAK